MEYTINELSKISGISTRALRYYDQIGLLVPLRISSNDYRIYSENEVDILQQILFYRELGVSLEEIKKLLNNPDYDKEKSLESHLDALLKKQVQIELLINNVRKTIKSLRGEIVMNIKEKFDGLEDTMRAEIGRANISDSEIIVELGRIKLPEQTTEQFVIDHLNEADVIALNNKSSASPLDIFVNEQLTAKGNIIVIDGNFGVKIVEVIDEKNNNINLKVDDFIELDKNANLPLDVFINNKLIAKGTVVVINGLQEPNPRVRMFDAFGLKEEDFFGLRITEIIKTD